MEMVCPRPTFRVPPNREVKQEKKAVGKLVKVVKDALCHKVECCWVGRELNPLREIGPKMHCLHMAAYCLKRRRLSPLREVSPRRRISIAQDLDTSLTTWFVSFVLQLAEGRIFCPGPTFGMQSDLQFCMSLHYMGNHQWTLPFPFASTRLQIKESKRHTAGPPTAPWCNSWADSNTLSQS